MEIIPAIDLRGGNCVRLYQGDYEQETVFSDDPLGVAERWQAEGGERLHIVDLDGAHYRQPRQSRGDHSHHRSPDHSGAGGRRHPQR